MKVFRLSKKQYSSTLSGKGAALFGNRWNSKGTEMIYTAQSRALSMAEVAVHLSLSTLPSDYMMIEIEIPDFLKFQSLKESELSQYWNSHPPIPFTQKIGDDFIDSGKHCILKVPSAVVKGDFNFLINPHHKDLKKIKILETTDFPFDKRMFK
ncbi:RES family NAD+ phosphorylase [Gillisia limnaea]|uniref:RES domain protein n=1 Tax=Gillisia limnaea (strain DSM 15749 / LMG 21470 / R-8282) TaxID=865937 RepID=H2BR32_GILLR|nr:RES family NAD+ phosphorylase [Gillisia limnaea]EHQ04351.1 RES domain protein [Gillisia limnaea DSM 15749]